MTLDTHPIMDMDVERRLGGVGPFVINLHASTAPIGVPAKSPASSGDARLYRIQRVDDGRVRYRLRLGPFATEDEAEAILAQVRLEYPCALLVTAAADDLHAIALVRGKANPGGSSADPQTADAVPPMVDTPRSTPPMTAVPVVPEMATAAMPAPAAAVVVPVTVAVAPARAAAVVVPVTAAVAPTRAAAVVAPTPVTAAVAPARAAAVVAPVTTAVAPARAAAVVAPVTTAVAPAAAVVVPVTVAVAPTPAVIASQRAAVSVASDLASMQALMAAIDTDFDIVPDKVAAKPPVLYTVHTSPEREAAKPTVRRDVARAGMPTSSLESTQTLRPLTPLELGEHEAPRWFVVQLAMSDNAFDPEALPHLDIFSLYRLYTVIGMDQGRLVHALRLGFFGEEAGARAVASYLAAFYAESIVKRVSVAERDRFADQRVEARKDVGATGRHLAIEITDELVVRERRSSR